MIHLAVKPNSFGVFKLPAAEVPGEMSTDFSAEFARQSVTTPAEGRCVR
jgi:hypothetical protein